jgi:chromosome segregation ATPase
MTVLQRMFKKFRQVPENVRGNFEAMGQWLRIKRSSRLETKSELNDSGFIKEYVDEPNGSVDVVVRKSEKATSIERMQDGLNHLVDELAIINSTLNEHVIQQRQLMERMEQLPRLVENFPNALQNQQQMMELLDGQFRSSTEKIGQFVENIKKLPDEAIRQTDTLISINRQLSAAADVDIVMNENFVKFNLTLEKLNQATMSQTDSVVQMGKTFAASDQYLKYMVTKQNKRFMLVFMISMGVCVLAILSLVTIIAFIK